MRAHRQGENTDRTTGSRRPTENPVHDPADRTDPEQALALQRTIGNAAVADVMAQRSGVREVLRSPGRPLDESVRADMESRLDADFGDVRLHTGSAAQRSADEVGARAWTSGSHVVIGQGGADGHTLAHELTHVIQQRSGPVAGTDDGTGLRISDPADRFEREAETNATRAMSGAATTVHDNTTDRSHGAQQIQRITEHSEGEVRYKLSESGRYAVIDRGRQVWVREDAQVSDALVRNPNGDRTINGQVYQEFQIRRWILKDCLHTAEEIINNLPGQLHSARELAPNAPASAGKYSRIQGPTTGLRDFGTSDESNIKNAREFGGAKDAAAAPRIGEAFVIVSTKASENEALSPYHAAAVVGVDGNDRVTLEEWDLRGDVSRGEAHMYTVGDASGSFHGHWAAQYFWDTEPITVVIRGAARPANLTRRTRNLDVFTPNTFADEPDRSLNWPDSE